LGNKIRTLHAVHPYDISHHFSHARHGLAQVTKHLRLDPRHFERVVPARQRTANHAGQNLFGFRERRVLIAVQLNLHSRSHELGEALSTGPVRGLSERDGGASGVKTRDAASFVRLFDSG